MRNLFLSAARILVALLTVKTSLSRQETERHTRATFTRGRQHSSWLRHYRLTICVLASTIAVLLGGPGYTQELVEYEFKGFITDNTGNLGVFGPFGTVQINDEFTGRFSYMTGPGNPDQAPLDPEIGGYNVIDFVIDQSVVPITPALVAVTHQPGIPTLPPLPPDLGTDGFRVSGTFLAGQEMKSISLRLEAPYQTVFSDDSLPTTLQLTDFPDLQLVRSIRVLGIAPDGMSQIDAGQITWLAKVPEPSSIILLSLGIGIIGVLRRSAH